MWDNNDEKHGEMTERPEEIEPPVDVAALKKELAEVRQKSGEYLTGWQRAQADFTNIRRRLEQDKLDSIKYAQGELILKLLPILDDIDRALKAIPHELNGNGWVQGIEGIARKLHSTLEAAGLKDITALGFAFNPEMHEGIAHLPGPEGMVVAEFEKGYRFRDRVLRPARVGVGSGEKMEQKE